jgi:hypothetical protein
MTQQYELTSHPEADYQNGEHLVVIESERVAYSLAGSRDIDRRTVRHRRELRDAGELPDRSFKNFPYEKERQELYDITRATTEYIRTNDIKTVFCLDRSARMVAGAITTYLDLHHADEAKPELYLINPMGCISEEDAVSRGDEFTEKLRVNNFIRQGRDEDTENLSSEQDILDEMAAVFPVADKNAPVLVFDTCLHSGDSVKPVIDKLEKSGFTDVRLGFCSTFENTSDIQPDFVALPDEPVRVCYPFGPGKSSGVVKTYDSVLSRYDGDQGLAMQLDQEISRVITTI